MDYQIEAPPILWVTDEFGQLLGLMKAALDRQTLARGFVHLLAEVGSDGGMPEYERVVFDVRTWHDPKSNSFWYVLQSRTNSIEDLRRIPLFR